MSRYGEQTHAFVAHTPACLLSTKRTISVDIPTFRLRHVHWGNHKLITNKQLAQLSLQWLRNTVLEQFLLCWSKVSMNSRKSNTSTNNFRLAMEASEQCQDLPVSWNWMIVKWIQPWLWVPATSDTPWRQVISTKDPIRHHERWVVEIIWLMARSSARLLNLQELQENIGQWAPATTSQAEEQKLQSLAIMHDGLARPMHIM